MRSSKLDFINSRMSLGARLATLSLIFCVPIVLLGFLFVTQSLKDIRATKQESAGSEYLANIWPTFEAAATDSKAGDTGSLETGRAKFDPAFGTAAASGAFVSATDSAAKLVAGNALMSAIADGSGLTLDPELDSFYVMSPVAFDIPALLLANTEVDVAAALPAQDPSRVPKLAEAFQSLQIASKNVSDHIQAGIKANAAGETKSALEDPNKKLKAAADAVLGHKAAALSGAGAQTLAADSGALETAAGSTWRASNFELARLLKARTGRLTSSMLTNLAGVAFALVIAAMMGLLIARGLSGRIGDLLKVMDKLIGGDSSVEVPHLTDTNETGRIAATVTAFKQSLIDGERMRSEAAAADAKAEHERLAADAERARAAEAQATVVADVAEGLTKLSAGVLTYRLSRPFAPSYEKLRADFNTAMTTMQDTMSEVAVNAKAVRSGAGEISQASDNLSRRTEQQAASLEETAAALDEITATVRRTAEGASQARDAVGAARSDAERSGIVVRDAVSAMSEIESSAQQISQIIGVIDEIAFQTNLLALNAGVEAARAGDAGRGFAVVASEVRALAQRSADAAKEIKALISASSQQVDRGVDLVGETGKVLERILTQVTQINGVVNEIAASAQEQATGLQQVNTAVNQMDQVTQQNAAMVEEATAASHALTGEADMLAKLISRFDLGAQLNPPSNKPALRVTATKFAPRRSGGGSLAVREDNWSEF